MIRFIVLIVMFTSPTVYGGGDSRWTSEETVNQAKERLLKRKKAFEKHLAAEEERERLRQSKADQQKAIRQKYAEHKEEARKQFRREEYRFPVEAYKKFVEKRERKKNNLEKARQHYSNIQNELREIYKNKQYQINGNKEFKL